MLDLIINTIGAVCVVMIFWFLFHASLPKTPKDGQADQIILDDYLQKITRVTGISAYDTFCKSAEEWRVPADRIELDFRIYLSSQSLPFYVKDFIRKSQEHIDELYVGKGGHALNKRLMIFFSFLVLLFWGGAVFLCLYVFPYILPDDLANIHLAGPP
ncbi:MAG: hypothetical protein P8X85_18205 [Desulfobacterales bacterium]